MKKAMLMILLTCMVGMTSCGNLKEEKEAKEGIQESQEWEEVSAPVEETVESSTESESESNLLNTEDPLLPGPEVGTVLTSSNEELFCAENEFVYIEKINEDGSCEVRVDREVYFSYSDVFEKEIGDSISDEMGNEFILVDAMDIWLQFYENTDGFENEVASGRLLQRGVCYRVATEEGDREEYYFLVNKGEETVGLQYDVYSYPYHFRGKSINVMIANESSFDLSKLSMRGNVSLSGQEFKELFFSEDQDTLWNDAELYLYYPIGGKATIKDGKLVSFSAIWMD